MALNGGEAIVAITWAERAGIKLGENRCDRLWTG